MKYRDPIARLISCSTKGKTTRTVLLFDKLPTPPLAPGVVGVADENNRIDPFIELHKVVRRDANTVTFETYGPQNCPLETGHEYAFRSWWTPDQLRVAQSEPHQWHRRCFQPSDMMAFRQPDGSRIGRKMDQEKVPQDGFVVKGGWDHEHCRLCWKTISEHEPDDHYGYVNDSDWVCQECFDRYLKSVFGKQLGDLTPT